MAQKPSIPKGTRDFGPIEMARRNYIFDTIRGVFGKYGYSPIETPAMENLSTLLGSMVRRAISFSLRFSIRATPSQVSLLRCSRTATLFRLRCAKRG